MNQVLYAQSTHLAAINRQPHQQDSGRPELHLKLIKRNRNRGVFLSHKGWQKLSQTGVLYNEFGERFSYGELSERSQLDTRTISRLLSCEVKVDRGTLKTFFRAFNLTLEADDYTTAKNVKANATVENLSACATLPLQQNELEQIYKELDQLKQQLREYDRLFRQLRMNENQTN